MALTEGLQPRIHKPLPGVEGINNALLRINSTVEKFRNRDRSFEAGVTVLDPEAPTIPGIPGETKIPLPDSRKTFRYPRPEEPGLKPSEEPETPKGKERLHFSKFKLALAFATGLMAGQAIEANNYDYNTFGGEVTTQRSLRDATILPSYALREIGNNLPWNKQLEVPATFDQNAKKGIIGSNNTVQMTPEGFAKLVPETLDRENMKTNIPVFVKLPEGYLGGFRYEIKPWVGGKTGQIISLTGLPVGTVFLWPFNEGIIAQGSSDAALKKRDGTQARLYAPFAVESKDGIIISGIITTTGIKLDDDIPVASLDEIRRNFDHGRQLKLGDRIGKLTTTELVNGAIGPVQIEILLSSLPSSFQLVQDGGGKAVTVNNNP